MTTSIKINMTSLILLFLPNIYKSTNHHNRILFEILPCSPVHNKNIPVVVSSKNSTAFYDEDTLLPIGCMSWIPCLSKQENEGRCARKQLSFTGQCWRWCKHVDAELLVGEREVRPWRALRQSGGGG